MREAKHRLGAICVCVLSLVTVAGTPLPADAGDGLVVHWRLDDVTEGRTPDAGPGGHHALLCGIEGSRPELVQGIIGGALRLRADRQQHLLPSPPLLLPRLREFTAMVWVLPRQDKVQQELLCQKRDHGPGKDSGWRRRSSAVTRAQTTVEDDGLHGFARLLRQALESDLLAFPSGYPQPSRPGSCGRLHHVIPLLEKGPTPGILAGVRPHTHPRSRANPQHDHDAATQPAETPRVA